MKGLLQQANTQAIGPANVEDRKQGKQQQFPEETRKILRQAGQAGYQPDEGSAAAARRAASSERAYQRYATPEEPTPHPARKGIC